MTEQSSQRSKVNVKASAMTLASAPSPMNSSRATASNLTRMATVRSVANIFSDTLDKIQSRRHTLKLDSGSTRYDRLKVTSSLQYVREDWGGITTIRYLQNGDKVAVGFNSGDLQILTKQDAPQTKGGTCETILKGWAGNDSISCIQFHPNKPNLMYASSTAGFVMRRDLEDQTNYNDFFISEDGNEIYCMDFTGNCQLVTVGRYATVRVYDVAVDKMLSEFGHWLPTSSYSDSLSSSSENMYHARRIYCVRTHPNEPFLFVTGGWDGVRVWDLRVEDVVRRIDGPFIFGDAVDVSKNSILTGSCEAKGSLQLWDLGSGFLMEDIEPPNKKVYLYGEYPYVAKFYKGDPTGDLVLYGVGGLELISIAESSILYLFEDEKTVEAVDSTDKKLAFGGKSNSVLFGEISFSENEVSTTSFSLGSHTFSLRSNKSSGSELKKEQLKS